MMDPMTKETREMIRDMNGKIDGLKNTLTKMHNQLCDVTEVVDLMVEKLQLLYGDEWPY